MSDSPFDCVFRVAQTLKDLFQSILQPDPEPRMFVPSKLLIASYMIGGCALGCLLEPILDRTKQPNSGGMVAGILALVFVLALANVWMYRKAARQPDPEFPTGLWERYANAVTATASFVVGFILVVSAVVFR